MQMIDRQAALRLCIEGDGHDDERFTEGYNFAVCEIREGLEGLPAIEPEVRRGRWITIFPDTAKCLYCGWWQRTTMYNLPDDISAFSGCYRFCPACGAQMDTEE